MLQIDRTNKDPFYRYMMPELECSRESQKTHLSNLPTVAKSLCREPDHIIKFMSISLGCKDTATADGKFYLVGSFEPSRLQQLLFDFIDKFVLCIDCRNPETYFVLDKGTLKRTCSSCGATFLQQKHKIIPSIERSLGSLSNVDTKYEKANKSSIHALISSSEDNSQSIRELFVQESMKLQDLFIVYFKPSQLSQLRTVLPEVSLPEFMMCIERMLQEFQKEDKLPSFIKALMKAGVTLDSIADVARTPSKDRSPLIKKNYKYFFESLDE